MLIQENSTFELTVTLTFDALLWQPHCYSRNHPADHCDHVISALTLCRIGAESLTHKQCTSRTAHTYSVTGKSWPDYETNYRRLR
jgi:hypothetical protein